MPGFDRTGPYGQGSRTGRELGKCNPANQKSNAETDEKEYPRGAGYRFGRGRGRGAGRAHRRRFGWGNAD